MKKNTKIILISILIVTAIVVGYLFYLSSQSKIVETDQPVISPLQQTQSKQVAIDSTITLTNNNSDEISLYKIDKESANVNLGKLTTLIGEDFELVDDLEFSSSYESDSGASIIFDKYTGTANFSLVNPISLNMDRFSPSDENMAILIAILNQLKEGLEYRLVDYSSTDRQYEVYISLVLDNVLIEQGASMNYTDMLLIDKNGDLIGGRIMLANVKLEQRVPLIKYSKVPSLINSNDALYEFQEIDNLYYEEPIASTIAMPQDVDGIDGDIATVEVLQTDSCVAQKMTLIYLYKRWDQNYLFPTYKIDCLGSDTVDGKEVEVPVVVYTNAIDTQYIQSANDSK